MNQVEASQQSEENSKKLDKIMSILAGSGDGMPGLVQTVASLRDALFGVQGRNGLTQKVDIMWRVYIWFLCSISAGFGFLVKMLLDAMQKTP